MSADARRGVLVVVTFGMWTLAMLDAVEHGRTGPSPLAPGVLAAGAAGLVGMAALAESWSYAVAWRAFGRAFAPWRVAAQTYVLSTLDVVALSLVAEAHAHPDRAAWIAWLAGARAAGPAPAGALAASLGGAGLLTLLRAALLAGAHAKAAGTSWPRAAAVVAAGWVLTRLVLWWTVDLVTGPLPGHQP